MRDSKHNYYPDSDEHTPGEEDGSDADEMSETDQSMDISNQDEDLEVKENKAMFDVGSDPESARKSKNAPQNKQSISKQVSLEPIMVTGKKQTTKENLTKS